jgi:hypothetical protein
MVTSQTLSTILATYAPCCAELMSAGAVVAASMGEPTLAHQLELVHMQAASDRRAH